MRFSVLRSLFPALALAIALIGCNQEPQPDSDDPSSVQEAETGEENVLAEGFSTPESVVYDPEQDVYFVSNINGLPGATDDNGYISRVDAETKEIDAKWIDGTKTDVTLHGPKGLTIIGAELWAADVTLVRRFDRVTGAEVGEIAIPDAIFLNDLGASDDGYVYLSDSGLEAAGEGLNADAKDSVYRLSTTGEVLKVASGNHLKRPDGVWPEEGRLWVTSFSTNEVYELVNGQKQTRLLLPEGSLDGLIRLSNGSFLVSSWDANGVYLVAPDGATRLIVGEIESPADIGYDSKRQLLLVPHLGDHKLSIHSMTP